MYMTMKIQKNLAVGYFLKTIELKKMYSIYMVIAGFYRNRSIELQVFFAKSLFRNNCMIDDC